MDSTKHHLMNKPIQTYIFPSQTPPFVCFLACLPAYSFASFSASLLAMPIMFIYFMPFHILFASIPSIACLLVFCPYLCMYTHGARKHEARVQSPRHKQKRRKHKYVDIGQAAKLVGLGV